MNLKATSLATLGISSVIVIATSIGASTTATNYDEYNTQHDIYNYYKDVGDPKSDGTFSNYIKNINKHTKNMSTSEIKNDMSENDATLSSWNGKTTDEKAKFVKGENYTVNQYQKYLNDEANLNFVDASTGTFIASISIMVIFIVIILVSGFLYFKNRKSEISWR